MRTCENPRGGAPSGRGRPTMLCMAGAASGLHLFMSLACGGSSSETANPSPSSAASEAPAPSASEGQGGGARPTPTKVSFLRQIVLDGSRNFVHASWVLPGATCVAALTFSPRPGAASPVASGRAAPASQPVPTPLRLPPMLAVARGDPQNGQVQWSVDVTPYANFVLTWVIDCKKFDQQQPSFVIYSATATSAFS